THPARWSSTTTPGGLPESGGRTTNFTGTSALTARPQRTASSARPSTTRARSPSYVTFPGTPNSGSETGPSLTLKGPPDSSPASTGLLGLSSAFDLR
ncbi:MAG TPA: hypothetical protein VHW70_12715, partial [Edaphobacter sp.]|nr:hypothetical protein [Edaphobacter sp.]